MTNKVSMWKIQMRRLRSPEERKHFRDGRNATKTAIRARKKTYETHLRRKHFEPAGQKGVGQKEQRLNRKKSFEAVQRQD